MSTRRSTFRKNSFNGNATITASDKFAPTQRAASRSRQSVASTVPTLLSLGPPTRDRELWRSDESVEHSCSNLTWSGTRPRKPGANYEPVSDVEELTLRSKRDRDVNVVQTLRDVEISVSSWNEMLNRPFEETMKLRKDDLKLKVMWRRGNGNKEVQKQPYMRLIENLNLNDYSFIKRVYGLTMLKERERERGR